MPKWWTSILIMALAYIVIVLWLLTFYAPSVFWVLVLTVASVAVSLLILKLVYDVLKEYYEGSDAGLVEGA